MKTLREVLDEVPDPRSRHGRRHPLGSILALAICAMFCGARSLYAIAQWGKDQGVPMAKRLGFQRKRTPDVSTLQRVFSRLDRERFELVLGEWLQEQGLKRGEALAIDGKTLRGIHGENLPGVHLLAAYAHQSGIVVGQKDTAGKGHELSTMPLLLEQLPLAGRVVTADAQFTHRQICEKIVQKGGTTSW